jgi:pentapeptide MXKDX repeat protein
LASDVEKRQSHPSRLVSEELSSQTSSFSRQISSSGLNFGQICPKKSAHVESSHESKSLFGVSSKSNLSSYNLMSKPEMSKDKMSKDKMSKDKMSKDKMSKDKMLKDKMSKDKMSKDKMSKKY